MPNLVNTAITDEYEQLLGAELDALFVQPVGLDVEDSNRFRAELAESNLRMQLLKGSLARRVLEAKGLSDLNAIFDGPAAVILPDADVDVDAAAIAAAKVVVKWKKDAGSDLPVIKGGVMEGEVLDADAATALEKLPGRAELLSILVGQILGPGRKLASQITAPGANIAGAIKTHIDNQEQSG